MTLDEQIEKARRRRSRRLDLTYHPNPLDSKSDRWLFEHFRRGLVLWFLGHPLQDRLTEIPAALTQLTNLQELKLSFNALTTIPDTLAKLTSLKKLDLSNNPLTTVPEALAQLTNLQVLDLSGTRLTAIPDALGQLTNLRFLYLSFNKLTAIPHALARLTKLETLGLFENPMPSEWQPAIKSHKEIEYLRSLAKTSEAVSPRATKKSSF